MRRAIVLAAALPVALVVSGAGERADGRDARRPGDEAFARARELCAKMTLEEKAGELMAYDYENFGSNRWEIYRSFVESNKVGVMMRVRGVADTRKIQRYKVEHSRLRIPTIFGDDVTRGYRTILPIELGRACSWDEALLERGEAMAARETAAAGLQLTYSPMVDLSEDPRWGRIGETCGEDPYLVSRLCAARVRGYQGRKPEELADGRHVLSCDKHFLGYASLMGGRDYRHRDFSRRELLETYLPPHRACIEAGAWAVMNAYTTFEGVPCNFNAYLLKTLLRDELGFRGQLMTDWATLRYSVREGASPDLATSAIRGLAAGVDMDMVGNSYLLLPGLVREGKVREADVDVAVVRSLALKFLMGLFDDPYRYCDEERERRELLSEENRRIALETVRESVVLLENDGILPLDVRSPVALAGTWADDGENQLSSWLCDGRAEDSVTLKAGMDKRWGERLEFNTNGIPAAETVVLALGECRTLSGERKGRAAVQLPDGEQEDLRRLKKAGKKVVSVVFAGRPVDLREVRELSAAVVYAWFPGTMGGEGLAEILSGETNPSAKLAITFPRHVGQVPITYREKRTFIACGYSDMDVTPLYPFGFGRSYTSFAYSKPKAEKAECRIGEPVRASVEVTNTGATAGREIVQLYVRDEVASVLPRERELKGFESVTLAPGETKRVTFELDDSAFALYDADLKRVVEPGEFKIFIGGDSTTSNAVSVVLR